MQMKYNTQNCTFYGNLIEDDAICSAYLNFERLFDFIPGIATCQFDVSEQYLC